MTARTYVAVRQSTFPGCDPVWVSIGAHRASRDAARMDGRLIAADMGDGFEFSIAVFEAGDVVQLLDTFGDPLDGWGPDDLADVRDDIKDWSEAS